MEHPLSLALTLLAVSLLPFLALSVTAYLKLHVVLGIVRNALGAQGVPSGAVVSLLSFVLTVQIMAPVGREMASVAGELPAKNVSAAKLFSFARNASVPLEKFLRKHSHLRERHFFAHGDRSAASPAALELGPVVEGESIVSLIPAFVVSELQEAFLLGMMLFLPFLVIDLVVTNILIGFGMMMVSPVSVALPLKLLLFVLCDGWFLLCRSLILSYG